jgi:hypothetical protein
MLLLLLLARYRYIYKQLLMVLLDAKSSSHFLLMVLPLGAKAVHTTQCHPFTVLNVL